MSGYEADLLVIGAGSAGFSAAITAAEKGASVVLAGWGTIGGTCVNVGCVPSKTLIRAAEAVHAGLAAHRFDGIRGRLELADWPALRRQKDALVASLRKAKYEDLLPRYPAITYLEGRARLVPGGAVVGEAQVRAERVILATGSRPAVPGLAGLEEVPWMDSTAALDQETLPGSMIVVGAGYIGVELAQMFARFGVQVTLVCRRRPLPEAEPEISRALTGCFEEEGIRVLAGLRYRRIEARGGGVVLTVEREGEELALTAERLLLATGRRPNSEGLGLDALGVACDERGAILVDPHMRTSRPGIYAAGDVTGRHMFVYM
ncbi:MAG TPA: FAD-dependent oxidoreductase, partial [Rhodospirillales bacterium]|nr:FAD-dependent oxidoreductase [Rhodospirillales bacterium]